MSGKEDVSEISPVLFLDTSGHSMRFYVRPGSTKIQLHPLIINGGGTLCRNQEPGSILLIDPGEVTSEMATDGQTYISTKYIKDCAEQNQQLDLDDYVLTVGPSVQTRMATRRQGSGRLGYSLEDDTSILKFIEKRQHEAKGNLVWKEMEKQHMTNHSWQSMKDRFLKHLQHKIVDKNLKKSPSKRKTLSFLQSPLSKKKVTSEPKTDSLEKSPQQTVVESDSSETQITTESSLCLAVSTNTPPCPERASSPPDVPQAAGEPPHASNDDSQDEPCVPLQEQETPETEMSRLDQEEESIKHSSPNKTIQTTCETSTTDSRSLRSDESQNGEDIPDEPIKHSFPNKAIQTTCETSTTVSRSLRSDESQNGEDIPDEPIKHSSPKETIQTTCETSIPDSRSPRLEQDRDGEDISDGSNEHSSPNKTKQIASKTSTPDSKKLGILAKAAREFEDSDVMDESQEGEDPCEVPIIEPSNTHESSASPATFAREPESQAEQNEEVQPASPTPEEECPGPSSTAVPPSSNCESQDKNCSQVRRTHEETLSRHLVDVKEHVTNLMKETNKDLVEVTKALFKASGDLSRALLYLLNGFDHEPLWTCLDDEILLLADSCELEQLQSKFGEEEVTRRRAFLTADIN